MGWKNLKEHFKINHIVEVTERGICIGSKYVHDLAIINPATGQIKNNQTYNDFLRRRYPDLLDASPEEIMNLINKPDKFLKSITVYTFDDGKIIKHQCEALGYPNVTHTGRLMYENTFSADREVVIGWAKRNAESRAELIRESIVEAERHLVERRALLVAAESDRATLEAKYPSNGNK